ncbi:kinase-like domain-containing protein [Durotheca rogersii]|uniref:kinase-like domain-containing protein n=1 Tax=Durotheca rogersii TaxID=419775 RepID=UPI00221F6D32|nr:kinase-like domain-containing protein [Durotheca rogersii]KAI5863893.1 kinase-like domain-containing protein [Durotheca rogersii]
MSAPSFPDTVFSLCPVNNVAISIVTGVSFTNLSYDSRGGPRLEFGYRWTSQDRNPLLTFATVGSLGRQVDVYDSTGVLAPVHCAFVVNYKTGVLLVEDRSNGLTQICPRHGETFASFIRTKEGWPRVAIVDGINSYILLGDADGPQAKFFVDVHKSPDQILDHVQRRMAALDLATRRKCLRTYPGQTPAPEGVRILHHPLQELGRGGFGRVMKTVDLYSGDFLAVKVLARPRDPQKYANWVKSVKMAREREVATMRRISHPYVVRYLGSQGWSTSNVEIFMAMKRGSLYNLVDRHQNPQELVGRIANPVTLQILSALDCLAFNRLVHRDVKPDNILWEFDERGDYVFKLADFGLANDEARARSISGTVGYAAPEIWERGRQSPKVDMWSFFVTLMWLIEPDFRSWVDDGEARAIHRAVIQAAIYDVRFRNTREMAIYDPGLRSSAAHFLANVFQRPSYLTTPIADIPKRHPDHFDLWIRSVYDGSSPYSQAIKDIMP